MDAKHCLLCGGAFYKKPGMKWDRQKTCSRSCALRLRKSNGQMIGRAPKTNKERFWPKVKKTAECWIWTGGVFKNTGYGKFRGDGGRTVYSHRVSWELEFGPAGDRYVLHTCDNRRCVNPSHLFLGDHQANVDDMIAKGRAAWQADRAAFVKATTKAARARVLKMRWRV